MHEQKEQPETLEKFLTIQNRKLQEALLLANKQLEMAAECIEANRLDEALLHCRSLIRLRTEALNISLPKGDYHA